MEPGKTIVLQEGDVVLLGSDGLWGPFLDDELVEAFANHTVAETLDNLIVHALRREAGHSDNATGVAIRWGSSEPAHHTEATVSHVLAIA
jgi:serine/threonine protein phosphatase PrpC